MAQKGDIDLEAWRLPLTEGGLGDWLVHFTNNALMMIANTNRPKETGLELRDPKEEGAWR